MLLCYSALKQINEYSKKESYVAQFYYVSTPNIFNLKNKSIGK
jgi:hypothetical protein